MTTYKTPGVYIVEKNAFPNSVVEVPTAVPAFLGYTERADRDGSDLTGVPTRISNMAEFKAVFGGPPPRLILRTVRADKTAVYAYQGQTFYLFDAMRIFFDNGGGPCWIVSVGSYETERPGKGQFSDAIWSALAAEPEPTMVVVPDAVALGKPDCTAISERMMRECAALQSRVAILEIWNGDDPEIAKVISGPDGFRNTVELGDQPSFGMAYYPWLNTTLTVAEEVDFTNLSDDSRKTLKTEIDAEQTHPAEAANMAAAEQDILDIVARLTKPPSEDHPASETHEALMAVSPHYVQAMRGVLRAINVLPPSGAMAGVIARIDNSVGVFEAPANTGIASVASPCVQISSEQQEDLNVPLDGKAVNAIRTFEGRGVLVWGAPTLDGNSQDFRYINVRRTLIMLEQSIFYAVQAYVFSPNDAGTWQTVQTMIANFLDGQWKQGALAGATPADAYDVSVGLGSTMTASDILDGYMRVTVRVAISRPAEFIVITFQQKMQTS